MPQTNKKSINHWTEKHDEFCLHNKLTPCAKLLWQWLIRQKDDEPDLKEFNNWVRKHRGKPYCRPSIKTAFNQLVECRVISVVKQFTWHLVRIITRSLEDLFPKKKCRNGNKNYATQPSTPQSVEKEDYSSSINLREPDLDSKFAKNLSYLQHEGFQFDLNEIEVLAHERRELELSVILFKVRGHNRKILNPEGWLRTCLRKRYFEQPRNSQLLELLGEHDELPPDEATSLPLIIYLKGLKAGSKKAVPAVC